MVCGFVVARGDHARGIQAAAAVCLVIWSVPWRESDQVSTRGGAPTVDRWVGIEVFRKTISGDIERLQRTFSAQDALLFAYRNGGKEQWSQ
ncbi:hypothetical protein ACFL6C_08455 [Myxococcota bacterium]